MAAKCEWHDCPLEDVSEHQMEQCESYGWNCMECHYFGDTSSSADEAE